MYHYYACTNVYSLLWTRTLPEMRNQSLYWQSLSSYHPVICLVNGKNLEILSQDGWLQESNLHAFPVSFRNP